jgi:hypothetical protein
MWRDRVGLAALSCVADGGHGRERFPQSWVDLRGRPSRTVTPSDVVVPFPVSGGAACSQCGHAKQAHQHYRSGTDCSLCSCPRFHRSLSASVRAVMSSLTRRFG